MLQLHQSASALAVGGIRTQFSNRGNVKFSLNSAEFIREIRLVSFFFCVFLFVLLICCKKRICVYLFNRN